MINLPYYPFGVSRQWRGWLVVLLVLSIAAPARADVRDPLDPFDRGWSDLEDSRSDEEKSARDLLYEAEFLLRDERPLDARTKLLRALQRDPTLYEAHLLLASYYQIHVNHFRLALRYLKRAQELFEEQHGAPPYFLPEQRMQHARILYLLAQIRLDLDNYSGALAALDTYESFGYMATWYPSSRAWILMKLGRLEEAIRVARFGVMQLGLIGDSASDKGRVFNMLGILLSMHGDKQESLGVFREAIRHEMSLGPNGQPGTPLNNIGEVYRELFQDEQAESHWLRAINSHDGCVHVLPSINLSLLYIEQANFQGAKRIIDQFEQCVAQYPLRNGEEHRGLVSMIRGRISLHTGDLHGAEGHFRRGLEQRQAFGKIGTSPDDLQAALLVSLAQTLERKNTVARLTYYPSIAATLASFTERLEQQARAWWLYRQARRILAGRLNSLEDLTIRNTDSMLEYPTLGEFLATFPLSVLSRRLAAERERDKRTQAQSFYDAYEGEALIAQGRTARGVALVQRARASARPRFDALLHVRLNHLLMQALDEGSSQYGTLAREVFRTGRGLLRSHGGKLPVRIEVESEEAYRALLASGFLDDRSSAYEHVVRSSRGENGLVLEFSLRGNSFANVKVRGSAIPETVAKFADEVFAETLS